MEAVDIVILPVESSGVEDLPKWASIWVRSTAIRDGHTELGSVRKAEAGIRRRLELVGATVLAAERSGATLGFALCAPLGVVLEVFYLGVDPKAWGLGIASRLLRAIDTHAGAIGYETCGLWVIDDNERAIGVYETAGWLGTDVTHIDVTSGRIERRLLRRTSDT